MNAPLRMIFGAVLLAGAPLAGSATYVDLPGGTFESVLGNDASAGLTSVAPYRLRTTPVTRGEFAAFIASHPQWQRQRAPRAFVDANYLIDAASSTAADTAARQPVTHVSWFAAQAYCEAEGGRLPTWYEWEFAAAADATRADARNDATWRARILGWYARPASQPPPAVGSDVANLYGVFDLHGVIWEWVDDFNALLVNADSRSASDPDKLRFCGAGAIDLQQREHYAILMRVALLSSLKGADSTSSLGFRCVQPINPGTTP